MPRVRTEALSGGWKRRLAIAREIAQSPDVLFLDEPTNHLDFEGIQWLEKLLSTAPFASVVVSHDRYFLDTVVNDVAEIDRAYPGGLFRVEGSYSQFLEKKEEFLLAQSNRQEALANRVRREVEWLRRGAKARTGKSKARIDNAGRLMRELGDLETRTAKGVTQIDFTATDRRTKRLLSVENISKELGGRTLFRDLSFTLSPGTRLGLAGPERHGQDHAAAHPGRRDRGGFRHAWSAPPRCASSTSTRRASSSIASRRCARGWARTATPSSSRTSPIHVAGWAKRFLFDSGQLDRPMSSLSGGEQARVLIARLMLQPADLLLLDEPTNDLDIPTLEVLEDSLTDFPGALVLVTHDRYLLDRVSTAVLGLDGRGGAQLFADYWQWEQAKMGQAEVPKPVKQESARYRDAPAKKKLSYHGSARVGADGSAHSGSGAAGGGHPRRNAFARSGLRRAAAAGLLREAAARGRDGARSLRALGGVGSEAAIGLTAALEKHGCPSLARIDRRKRLSHQAAHIP